MKMKVIHSAGPFRFVDCGEDELGKDYRMQELNWQSKRWYDVYQFDCQLQMFTAIEDHEYAKWLAGHPAYARKTNTITNPYK